MDPNLNDWLNLLLRWLHLITGAAWIGTSFYFNWLNHSLRPPQPPREGIAGELLSVHGGAFYQVSKYQGAPATMPSTLHWFKWEAYFTWITGISLLTIVYYFNAKIYLIDPNVLELTPNQAISISLATLVGGWLVYDTLCKSPLKKFPMTFTLLGFILLSLVAWGLTQVFSGRAAYIHVGAIIGTIMAANVFWVIIPNQKRMVNALLENQTPDLEKGKEGALRSLHNNYFTLPVLFIMVSNHFPMTYGHRFNWAVLAGLSLIGAGTKHYFNLKHQGHKNVWILPVAATAMLALAFVSHSTKDSFKTEPNICQNATEVRFLEAQGIIQRRCLPCHSANPSHPAFPQAPGGIMYDTPAQIQTLAPKIETVAVQSKTMPLGNLTKMTDQERVLLGQWIRQGAPIQ
ncbi:MAG: urate hydroxylase PuuD [Myxococcota bacterium]|nr:urate hydroxylase PuuD [Myxococcota bacterium]